MSDSTQTRKPAECRLAERFKRSLPILFAGGAAIAGYFNLGKVSGNALQAGTQSTIQPLGSFPVWQPEFRYGLALDTFQVVENEFGRNQSLSDVLTGHGLSSREVANLVDQADTVFRASRLKRGQEYLLLKSKVDQRPMYFVFEPDERSYIVCDLQQQTTKKVLWPVSKEVVAISAQVNGSLWKSLEKAGASDYAIDLLQDVLAWSVDFHHARKNDKVRFVYEQEIIRGKAVDGGRILGAWYTREDEDFYAIYHENNTHKGFFDIEGRPMKKSFLQAPVKAVNISSGYGMARLHPILKDVRPHYGTDYAAPHGTPIMSVADGVILEARNGGNNGNYVKIRHDKTYETQYLHMSRFERGIRPGVKVRQGQVIGFVGATGLATGPHVCFRFWKNGQQVDHRRLRLPKPEKMPATEMEAFEKVKQNVLEQLKKADQTVQKQSAANP